MQTTVTQGNAQTIMESPNSHTQVTQKGEAKGTRKGGHSPIF